MSAQLELPVDRVRLELPDDGLPIMVRDWDDEHPALMLACSRCGEGRMAGDSEVGLCDLVAPCDRWPECRGWMEWAYSPGSSCRNCDALAWSHPENFEGACSRACQLQLEYAAQLAQNGIGPAEAGPMETEVAGPPLSPRIVLPGVDVAREHPQTGASAPATRDT